LIPSGHGEPEGGWTSPLVTTSAIVGEGVARPRILWSTLGVKAGGSGGLSNQKLWHSEKERRNRINSGITTMAHFFLWTVWRSASTDRQDKWQERLKGQRREREICSSIGDGGGEHLRDESTGRRSCSRLNPEKLELVFNQCAGRTVEPTPRFQW
jgi:hypothetical protein